MKVVGSYGSYTLNNQLLFIAYLKPKKTAGPRGTRPQSQRWDVASYRRPQPLLVPPEYYGAT